MRDAIRAHLAEVGAEIVDPAPGLDQVNPAATMMIIGTARGAGARKAEPR
jgi:hypothetical protein